MKLDLIWDAMFPVKTERWRKEIEIVCESVIVVRSHGIEVGYRGKEERWRESEKCREQ